jgi:hypothetical protein
MLVFTVHACGTVKFKTSVFCVDFGGLFIICDELLGDDELLRSLIRAKRVGTQTHISVLSV